MGPLLRFLMLLVALAAVASVHCQEERRISARLLPGSSRSFKTPNYVIYKDGTTEEPIGDVCDCCGKTLDPYPSFCKRVTSADVDCTKCPYEQIGWLCMCCSRHFDQTNPPPYCHLGRFCNYC